MTKKVVKEKAAKKAKPKTVKKEKPEKMETEKPEIDEYTGIMESLRMVHKKLDQISTKLNPVITVEHSVEYTVDDPPKKRGRRPKNAGDTPSTNQIEQPEPPITRPEAKAASEPAVKLDDLKLLCKEMTETVGKEKAISCLQKFAPTLKNLPLEKYKDFYNAGKDLIKSQTRTEPDFNKTSIEDVRAMLMDISEKHGKDLAKAYMKKFGNYKTINDIPKDTYGLFYHDAKEVLETGEV